MAEIPFVTPLDDPAYGTVVTLSPLVRRVVANNPSRFSYRGTGTYIVGRGDVAVIDPGPALDEHSDALLAALVGSRVRAILVTHCHSDHSPLAAWLKKETGAPTIAFGPHGAVETEVDDEGEDDLGDDDGEDGSRSDRDEGLPDAVDGPGDDLEVIAKETTEVDFIPDIRAVDGSIVAAGRGWTVSAVHTPGHTSNHLCFVLHEEQALFSGDHVMGWSTTVVSPPDGDMRHYIQSLRKVIAHNDRVLYPTHGNPITDPQPFLAAYLAHRLEREQQVLAMIDSGVGKIRDIVQVLYAQVDPKLHKAAGRSVLAHIVSLVEDGRVAVADGGPPRSKAAYLAVPL